MSIFFFMAEYYSVICLRQILFIHSSVSGPLVSYLWAFVESSAAGP